MFDDDALKTGTVVDGRFTLVRRLGHGGFGVVWLATDAVLLGREIALKVLHPQFGGAGAEQLAREAAVLGRLDHPNVARAVAFSSRGALTYLATEYVDGQPLHQFMAACGGTPMLHGEVARIFDELCSAVAYAHDRGVIHRDLKPQNVMIQRLSSRLYVKVLDFGVAKLLEKGASDGTTQGRTIGSLFYMSPEQTRGDPTTIASDIFALGTMLFELLTLRRTWAHDRSGAPLPAFTVPLMSDVVNSLPNVVDRIQRGARPRASEIVPGVPREIDAVIAKALAFEPGDRYPEVDALRAAVIEILAPGAAVREGATPRGPGVEAEEELATQAGVRPSPRAAVERHAPTLQLVGGVSSYVDEPVVLTEHGARGVGARADATQVHEDATQVREDATQVREDATQVREDATQVREDATQVRGDATVVTGDVTHVTGDVTHVTGDATQTSGGAARRVLDPQVVAGDWTEVRGPTGEGTSVVETRHVLSAAVDPRGRPRTFDGVSMVRSRRLLPLVLGVATLMIGAVLGMALASRDPAVPGSAPAAAVVSGAPVPSTTAPIGATPGRSPTISVAPATLPSAAASVSSAPAPSRSAAPAPSSPASAAAVRSSPTPRRSAAPTAPASTIAGLLRHARETPTDAAALARLGAAIAQAAERVPDAGKRGSIRRIASSSAMIGNLGGLEQAYRELDAALTQAGEVMP